MKEENRIRNAAKRKEAEVKQNVRYKKQKQRYVERRNFGNAIQVLLAILCAILIIWVATDIKQNNDQDRYANSEGVAKTFMNYIREISNVEGLDYKGLAQEIQEKYNNGESSAWTDTLTAIRIPAYTITTIIHDISQYIIITYRYLF